MARKLPRCDQCGKAVFPTERAARAHARKVRKSLKRRMSVYLAPCGSWHLTSQPQRSRLLVEKCEIARRAREAHA